MMDRLYSLSPLPIRIGLVAIVILFYHEYKIYDYFQIPDAVNYQHSYIDVACAVHCNTIGKTKSWFVTDAVFIAFVAIPGDGKDEPCGADLADCGC